MYQKIHRGITAALVGVSSRNIVTPKAVVLLSLAMILSFGTHAYAYRDDGFRFDAERWGCFDRRGLGRKSGLNAGWIDFDWKSLECSGLAGTRSIQGMNLTDFLAMGADLSAMDLRGVLWLRADLRAAKLTSASLADRSGAWGSRAFFWNAKLQRASLERVVAPTVEFVEAHLEEADLRAGDFSGADFTRASLVGAALQGTILFRAKFQGTDLRRVQTDADTDWRGAEFNAQTRLPFSRSHALKVGMLER